MKFQFIYLKQVNNLVSNNLIQIHDTLLYYVNWQCFPCFYSATVNIAPFKNAMNDVGQQWLVRIFLIEVLKEWDPVQHIQSLKERRFKEIEVYKSCKN